MSCLFLRIFLLLLFWTTIVTGQTIRREFNLTIAYASNSSSILLVNNQFPGPLIRANVNDILIVHIHNALKTMEEVDIHFHGMLQRQTPQMDGVGFVTQMPIPSGQTFTHVFHAYPAGTYLYHSHAGLQAVTAFGPVIVDDPKRLWEVEEAPSGPLMFSDQWEGIDRLTQEKGLLGSPFIWEGEPSYLLINGQRNFVLTLDPGKTYLLRLIGATSLSTLAFGINEHPMTVVEVDGKLVKPRFNLTSIEISSGQRYAVLIETKEQSTGLFAMQASIRWRAAAANSSCIGILRYGVQSQIPTNISSLPLPSLSNETDFLWFSIHDRYETLLESEKMPKGPPNREYLLSASQEHTPDGGGIRWLTNNATFDMLRLKNLTRSLLIDLYHGNEQNLPLDVIYPLKRKELVDIVVQNTVALNGVCESHPMHMHGHKFWVHSYGNDTYNAAKNTKPDKNSPVLRDSLMVYASSYAYFTPNRNVTNHRQSCGWTKLRMIADNPGLWMFHCHIGAHGFMGMNILLKEDIEHLSMIYLSQN